MKILRIVAMVLFVSSICASDRRDPAEGFFQTLVSSGAFEDEGNMLQNVFYAQGKMSVNMRGSFMQWPVPSLQPDDAKIVCAFCNEVLLQRTGKLRSEYLLKWELKYGAEHMIRKQDKILADLLAEWRRYRIALCPKK